MNINVQIKNLISELQDPELRNPLFSAEVVTPPHTLIQQAQELCFLEESEIAQAEITLERIEVEDCIENYMAAFKSFARSEDMRNYLQQIKNGGKYKTEAIHNFFKYIKKTEDKIFLAIESYHGIVKEQALAWYEDWKQLKKQETLSRSAQLKLRHAMSLRKKLCGDLRFLGYSKSDILEIMKDKPREIQVDPIEEFGFFNSEFVMALS